MNVDTGFIKNLLKNPDMTLLREFTFNQGNVVKTTFNSPNAITKVKSMSAKNTFIVTDNLATTD